MEKNRISNYEKLCRFWQERFLTIDQEALLKKVPCIKEEGEYLAVTYYQKCYGIHRKTGQIVCLDTPEKLPCVSEGIRMNIYNLCWFSRENAALQNRWVPFRDVKNASPFTAAFQKNVLNPFAATFEHKVDLLKMAAEKLGGKPLPQGDAGYEIAAFPCVPLRFLFWDGDEEFDAQANILFDYSITDFVHEETSVTIASHGVERLAEEAGIPVAGKTF
ncbi:MAG: DUF3786 domain-containing protein [Fusicatenibacter sp.]|nr:DUF3786 domain-containing protein [Fusicatenibacter sp.]